MSVKITYFVHGTTTDNKEHKATGWNPGVLSEVGIEQAKALRAKIDINKFDVVFCSDLQRAIDSAIYVFGEDKKIIKDERLRECNYGDFNGKDSSFVKYENHIEENFPNGESMLDIEKRIKSFCEFILKNYDGMHIAIVAHKAPQLAFQVLTEGKSWIEAIEKDWRKTKAWQPGWDYVVTKQSIML